MGISRRLIMCGTVNNICKRGINKGLIYHNFKDKDDLYLVCLENSCKKLVSMIEESGCLSDQLQYLKLRMRFFTECPNEAHIFFEAILLPHSGVSLVFTGTACATLGSQPELVGILQGTIAAAAVINEIIAAIAAKKGFELAGKLKR